jgi:hypothetical protein
MSWHLRWNISGGVNSFVFDELPWMAAQVVLVKCLLEAMLYGVLCKISHSESADHNSHGLAGSCTYVFQ